MIELFPSPSDAGSRLVPARSPSATTVPDITGAVGNPKSSFAWRRLAFRLAVMALAISPGAALAQQARLDASRLTCAALQRALDEAGAAIVQSRSPYSANMLSDRFVARVDLCAGATATLRPATVIAADTRSCRLTRCGGRPRGDGR